MTNKTTNVFSLSPLSAQFLRIENISAYTMSPSLRLLDKPRCPLSIKAFQFPFSSICSPPKKSVTILFSGQRFFRQTKIYVSKSYRNYRQNKHKHLEPSFKTTNKKTHK